MKKPARGSGTRFVGFRGKIIVWTDPLFAHFAAKNDDSRRRRRLRTGWQTPLKLPESSKLKRSQDLSPRVFILRCSRERGNWLLVLPNCMQRCEKFKVQSLWCVPRIINWNSPGEISRICSSVIWFWGMAPILDSLNDGGARQQLLGTVDLVNTLPIAILAVTVLMKYHFEPRGEERLVET